jgi:hypothetical protein
VGLPYASSPDVALGVQHLQMLGVRYYMALNSQLQEQAAADPSLKLLSTFGPFYINYSGSGGSGPSGTQKQYWKLYLIQNSPRVHPLANQPVVMNGLNNSSQPKYLKVMTTWYDDPSAWNVYLAASGPSSWARVPYGDTSLPVKPEPTTKVSDIVEHNASLDFNVTRTGVPVVVTVSYFPNWHVSGAQGVYRISPNLMVVVPTSHHVSLSYGYTPVDYEGWGLTLLALVGLVFLIRRPVAPVAAVRRPALGQRQAVGPTTAAAAGTMKDLWGHVRGPAEPRPPWPVSSVSSGSSDGPTNGAEARGGDTGDGDRSDGDGSDGDGSDGGAEAGNGAPAPYAEGDQYEGNVAAPYGPGPDGPGPDGPGPDGPGMERGQPPGGAPAAQPLTSEHDPGE